MSASVDLTSAPDLQKLIEAELETSRFSSAADFLTKAAFHYVLARDLGEEYTRDEIETKIARGLAQIECGETVDGDEFFEGLRLRGAALRRLSA